MIASLIGKVLGAAHGIVRGTFGSTDAQRIAATMFAIGAAASSSPLKDASFSNGDAFRSSQNAAQATRSSLQNTQR